MEAPAPRSAPAARAAVACLLAAVAAALALRPRFLPQLGACTPPGLQAGAPAAPLGRCTDGESPGRWEPAASGAAGPAVVDGRRWAPRYCRYKDVSPARARECLAGAWVHLAGDSTSRHLFEGLLDALECPLEDRTTPAEAQRFDKTFACDAGGSNNTRVTHLFKGQIWAQRAPRRGRAGDDDVHNSFFRACAAAGRWPDVLVLNVGAHHAIAWSGRLPAALDAAQLAADAAAFLAMLHDELKFPGRVVWWRGHALREGKARVFYDDAGEALAEAFRARGAEVADFRATTVGAAPEAGNGVHYPQLKGLHANILLNVLCPAAG